MNPHHLFAWYRKQAKRIVLAEIALDGEREATQIFERPQLARMRARGIETAPIVRHVLIRVLQRPAQPFELQCAHVNGHPRLVTAGSVRPSIGNAQPPRPSPRITAARNPWYAARTSVAYAGTGMSSRTACSPRWSPRGAGPPRRYACSSAGTVRSASNCTYASASGLNTSVEVPGARGANRAV